MKLILKGSEIWLGGQGCNLGFGTLIGQMTEINAWDRPLSVQEVDDFIEGCSGNFSQKYNPKAINWSNITSHFSYRGTNTAGAKVAMEDICPLVNNTNQVSISPTFYEQHFLQ